MRIATILFVLISAIFVNFASADNPALVHGQITVFGPRIEVSPAVPETSASVQVFANTTGKGLAGTCADQASSGDRRPTTGQHLAEIVLVY